MCISHFSFYSAPHRMGKYCLFLCTSHYKQSYRHNCSNNCRPQGGERDNHHETLVTKTQPSTHTWLVTGYCGETSELSGLQSSVTYELGRLQSNVTNVTSELAELQTSLQSNTTEQLTQFCEKLKGDISSLKGSDLQFCTVVSL